MIVKSDGLVYVCQVVAFGVGLLVMLVLIVWQIVWASKHGRSNYTRGKDTHHASRQLETFPTTYFHSQLIPSRVCCLLKPLRPVYMCAVQSGNQPRVIELVVSGIAGLQYFALIGQASGAVRIEGDMGKHWGSCLPWC